MSPESDTARRKAALRARAVAIRAQARAAQGDAPDRLAAHADRLAVEPGAVVAGYWPMGDEIDPRPLLVRLAHLGSRLALPVVEARGRPLVFRAWAPGDPLEPGPHGTRHPFERAPVRQPALVLVPLLAFDSKARRLGYGGGYYDRTLEVLRAQTHIQAIGVAFAAQQVPEVPTGRHDVALDGVLTEDGLMRPEDA